MHALHPHRQLTLARRLAAGLPVWVLAREAGIDSGRVDALMQEPQFRELVDAWSGLMRMDREARSLRLELLADGIIEDALHRRDLRAAMFVKRQRERRRDPVLALAQGFERLLDREAKAARRYDGIADAPEPQTDPEPHPQPADVVEPGRAAEDTDAAAQAAAAMRPASHPVDAAIWRKAGALRREMLQEQLLHRAAAAGSAGSAAGAAAEVAPYPDGTRPQPVTGAPHSSPAPAASSTAARSSGAGSKAPAAAARTPAQNLAAALARKKRMQARQSAGWPRGP